MAEITAISWTDHTFNVAWGCMKVSEGCAECYAEKWAKRCGLTIWGHTQARRTFTEKHWAEPLKWNALARNQGKRHRVFCSSMCDVFEDHPTIDLERQKLWPLIRQTEWLDWQLLTKRPERVAQNLPLDWNNGWPNVWLGTSIECDKYIGRAELLRQIPATVRFISYEPALGSLDTLDLTGIDWVIYGGESGPHHREHKEEWARGMRDRCRQANVAFFYKQSSGRFPGSAPTLDGDEIKQYPRRRIELPTIT